MLNKESELLHLFAKEPWKAYTFTEIKKTSRKKSKSYVDKVVKKFVDGKILRQANVGKLPVYSLNIGSAKARNFAGFVLEYYGWNKKHIPYNDLQKIIDMIPYRSYVFIVTGSYARGKQTKNSDIDVVILIEDSSEPKRVYAELSQYCQLNIPTIHLYVFKYSEFTEMLCNKEPNYGKEIAKNCLILAGGEVYIKLIEEAIENGFNDRRLA
jgi:predicted nucleotidyltransferase